MGFEAVFRKRSGGAFLANGISGCGPTLNGREFSCLIPLFSYLLMLYCIPVHMDFVIIRPGKQEDLFMKRIGLLFFVITLSILLVSCGQPEKLENMEYVRREDGSYGSQIKWGDTIYVFWGAADTDLIDKQIGIVDGDKKEKVYSVRGYSSTEWLIHHYDVIMSTYEFYKADSVTDIPEEFAGLKAG